MGAIRDRLRVLYQKNGNKLDPAWTLESLFAETELAGNYFERSDFKLRFPPNQPDVIRIECANAFPPRNGPLVLTSDLRTQADLWEEPPVDPGKDLSKALAIALAFFTLFGIPAVLFRHFWRKPVISATQRLGYGFTACGFWLFFCGLASTFLHGWLDVFWESPPPIIFFAAGIAAIGGLAAIIVGVGLGLATS